MKNNRDWDQILNCLQKCWTVTVNNYLVWLVCALLQARQTGQRWTHRPCPALSFSLLLQIWQTPGHKISLTVIYASVCSQIIYCNVTSLATVTSSFVSFTDEWCAVFHCNSHGTASVSFEAVPLENKYKWTWRKQLQKYWDCKKRRSNYSWLFGCKI